MNTDSFFATNIRISIRFNMSTEVLNSASSNSMAKKRRGKSFAAECAGINHPICLDSDNNLIKCEHFNSRSQFLNKRLIKFREKQFSFFFLLALFSSKTNIGQIYFLGLASVCGWEKARQQSSQLIRNLIEL